MVLEGVIESLPAPRLDRGYLSSVTQSTAPCVEFATYETQFSDRIEILSSVYDGMIIRSDNVKS
jgi:hypothetical protein